MESDASLTAGQGDADSLTQLNMNSPPQLLSDPPQQNYLQQDVHVDVMLRHNLPNVPFDSSHQQKHLLVVDGLGGDDPVYRLP